MENQNYDIIRIIRERAQKNLTKIKLYLFFIFIIILYLVYANTISGNRSSPTGLYIVFTIISALFFGLILYNIFLYKVNIKNSIDLNKGYIEFNKKYYIRNNKIIRIFWYGQKLSDMSRLFSFKATDVFDAAASIYVDNSISNNANEAKNSAELLDLHLKNYFLRLNSSPQNIEYNSSSIYPTAIKGFLAETPAPALAPALAERQLDELDKATDSIENYQNSVLDTIRHKSFYKTIVSAIFGLFFPVVYVLAAMAITMPIGIMLAFIFYPVIVAAAVIYIFMQGFVLKKLSCFGAYYISIIASVILILDNYFLANADMPIIGINRYLWHIIALTLVNSLVIAVLVSISEYINRKRN